MAGYGGGYWGAERNRRFRNFRASDRGPNSLLVSEGETLRARARQLTRGSSQGAAARRAAATHVIGEGIKPRSMHPDQKTRDLLDQMWLEVADTIDADGVDDFNGLQATIAAAEFTDGECFVRRRPRRPEDGLPVGLQVQALESDLLPLRDWDSPALAGPQNRLVAGVELDAIGRRAAYHFLKAHPRDQVDYRDPFGAVETHRVLAGDVLHVYERLRPGQVRGETHLASVIEAIWQLASYSVAEMDRAGLAARLNAFIEQTLNAADDFAPPLGAPYADGTEANPTSDGTMSVDLESGEIPVLDPGQAIKSIDIKQDAAAYEKFALAKHHEIGAGVGVPYELITGDFSRVTFASARTALRAYQRTVLRWQRRIVVQLCRPVWVWVIDAAFESGRLKDAKYPANRADYLRVDWTAPHVEFVDPLKELQAFALAVEQGFMSRDMVVEELGYDPAVVDRRIAQDRLRKMGPSSFGPVQTQPVKDEEPEEGARVQ